MLPTNIPSSINNFLNTHIQTKYFTIEHNLCIKQAAKKESQDKTIMPFSSASSLFITGKKNNNALIFHSQSNKKRNGYGACKASEVNNNRYRVESNLQSLRRNPVSSTLVIRIQRKITIRCIVEQARIPLYIKSLFNKMFQPFFRNNN